MKTKTLKSAMNTKRRGVMAIDFLSVALPETSDIVRSGNSMQALRPWSTARFESVVLRPGWWWFESVSDETSQAAEVRLSCPTDPMIVFSGSERVSQLVYIRGQRLHNVELLLSPWPSVQRYTRLRLTRMCAVQSFGHLLHWAADRVRRRGLGAGSVNAVRRMIAGQAIGISSNSKNSLETSIENFSMHASEHGAVVGFSDEGVEIFVEEGDRLHEMALAIVRGEFSRSSSVQAIYSDVCEGGEIIKRMAWDPVLAEYADIPGLPVFFRAGASSGAPSHRAKALAQQNGPDTVRHIALPLASRSARLRTPLAPVPCPDLDPWPSVSIVIPSGPRTDLLRNCLTGLTSTDYPDLQIVLVANGADRYALAHVLDEASERLRILTLEDNREFNFSRSCNLGVEQTTGEIVVLLNDDVEIIDSSWLRRMAASVMEKNVGAVGARLLYPDRSIQHAGVMLGIGGVCGHLWKGMSPREAECNAGIVYPGVRMAVTGACLAVRREHYRRVGGLDEFDFPVGMNDIDFCLKLRAIGLQTIYRGDAVLIHHESKSRGLDDDTVARRRRRARETTAFFNRWGHLIGNDPLVSPAFDPLLERGLSHRLLSCVDNAG